MLKDGFWANFKAALGLGMGGGMGVGFGWKVGQWLGELFIKSAKWLGILATGAALSWCASDGGNPDVKAAREARHQERLKSAPPDIRKLVESVGKPTEKAGVTK